ncbi:MAG TPA: DegT/DnrJ/EryC1/StrS family aminotransferase [Opitutaceae bacterium]|nr:DegT/DnrJ/EryC1/StrS family aminotransferase [Opitutaceae bacterium]
MKMNVPFLDLRAQHDPLRGELLAAIAEVVDRSAFAGGPLVAKFEEEFAAYCQTRAAVGVGSGTEALWLVLLARGIGPGDEVITVPNTFMATAEAISYCGAKPVLVDVDEQTYTLDPSRLERAITPRTKAVIPVHLFGQMADMDPIMEIARRHHLVVIEDACQAHGAEYKGRRAGSIGDAGCYSFYPGKNLGAWGEAGAVVTNDLTLAEKIRILRDHGQERKYHHSCIGWNARMDGIQAAVLRVKLKALDRGNAARRAHARLYDELLGRLTNLTVTPPAGYGVPVYHLYVVRVPERDRILRELAERGIACGIHYPQPIHLQEAYRGLGLGPGAFPVAERCAGEILSLPMFPELTPAQIALVVRELATVLPAARIPEARVA